MEKYQTIEHSIITKFRPTIYRLFVRAIDEYKLIKDGDKVAVCISGGKDSMLLAKCMEEFQKHGPIEFEAIYLCMNPGYSEKHLKELTDNAKLLNIPLDIFETNIFDVVHDIKESPCYLCARMRRGYLYANAKKRGCNKIALGHHFDDVIETNLMGMLYSGQLQTMMPKLHSRNFPGMELIRPLYFIREDDIKAWRDYTGLHFIQCACRFTDTCTTCRPNEEAKSKRQQVKQLIRELKKTNPDVEAHIFRSMENVCLDTVIAYKTGGRKISFLENYDKTPENRDAD